MINIRIRVATGYIHLKQFSKNALHDDLRKNIVLNCQLS